jgi:endoglucanase
MYDFCSTTRVLTPRLEENTPARSAGGASRLWLRALLLVVVAGIAGPVQAAKLLDVSVLDKDYLIAHFSDGDVVHNESGIDSVVRYTPELSTTAATQTGNWTITSSQDTNYSGAGKHPQNCYRKKKLSGHAQENWSSAAWDYIYEYTYEHWVYLRLPSSLQQGKSYTLAIASGVNSDTASKTFTFDIYNSRSEAIHVNLVGYAPDAPHKAADLYYWMGNGGARSYSSFQGNTVSVYDVNSGQAYPAGQVAFWKASGGDVGGYNLTRSDVWTVDFSTFTSPGTYRLVVDGVGCSQDFVISDDVYANPFKVGVRGYFYMRIGEQNPRGLAPPPRTPLYIPGVSPPNTVVYLTEMQPWHPQWDSFSGDDKWDNPSAWAAFVHQENPTNPNAWGGHSDAADWDRNFAHVVNIYDMLLPYILTNGAVSDDDTGITESGNGIPDIIDEARNEVDFWLRLRDGDGYSYGLTNPDGNVLYQAGPTAISAWANALNAAMLADALRIAGQASLANQYRDAAIEAYNHANGLADPQLNEVLELDDGKIRGRDFKMMAAAFLYNVTGDRSWETVLNQESVCAGGPSTILDDSHNQIWGTAAYLVTPRTVHNTTLQGHMRTQIVNEAKSVETNNINSRPSRRATDNAPGYWQTAQHVSRTMIAHAVTTDASDKALFRKALDLEADWGLGRNPLNIIQMTTATTPLASKRSVTEAYTSGRDDGVAGVHPGHTPYMNLDDWDSSMVMGRPSALYQNSYPSNVPSTWPAAEAYFPSRWVWAANEFTPRQTMRGKMALYGYLYGLAAAEPPANPTLVVSKSGSGSGTVTSNPSGISCGSTCSHDYANGTNVTLTASAGSGSTFTGWGGACFGNDPTCTVSMTLNRSVTATFDPVGLTYTLSVAKAGTGTGTVTSNPSGISCGSNCSEAYLSGTSVDLSASADSGSAFTGWSGACSGTGTCTVAMSAARTVTATFMSANVPTVTIYGDVFGTGWESWSWDYSLLNTAATSPVKVGTKAVKVALDGYGGFSPATTSAVINTYGYDAIKFWLHGGSGSNKTLSFYTQDVARDGQKSTEVPVTAVANTWTEITVPMSALGNPALIARLNFFNPSGSAISTISFDDIRVAPGATSTYPLSVTHAGNGTGTVTSNPTGIDCGSDCSETYASGTPVTLTAAPATGSTFGGWSGACSGTATTCSVTMDAVRSLTATFDIVPTSVTITDATTIEGNSGTKALAFNVTLTGSSAPTLTVTNAGAGFGSVTSQPSGITCGSDCSELYLTGTAVTLTPFPAVDSTFTGWSGACTGTGACTVTMSAARSVTATFDGPGKTAGSLRWVGRVDASNPNSVRFAWQGAGFVATMTGPTIAVKLTSASSTIYFQPVVDGIPGTRFQVPTGGVQTITIASGLSDGDHVVELYRDSEGTFGVSTFTGFAQGTVTGAPTSSSRVIEVVGDSISAGYGDLGYEAHPPVCTFSAQNSSWFKTYAALAGRAFGGEVSSIARSGWGMYRDNGGNTSNVLSSVYGRAVGPDDSTPWGFNPKASLVIVNLGTNDIFTGDPGTPYETAYINFINTVRGKYPDAWIFATIGSMLSQPALGQIKTHLTNVVNTLNDPKVVTFDMGTQDTTTTGCDWHPDVDEHARMAEIIKTQIHNRLGW